MSQRSDTTDVSIWSPAYRALTIGSVLAITIVAFQGLALATIAPILADELGGRGLYGWIFSAFILPQIVGTVVAGQEVDRRNPALVFFVAMVVFAAGCIVAGFAVDLSMLFAGRALQGFGAGAMFSCVYAVINSMYSDRMRPSLMAALSSAWIIPSLLGPALAGFLAENIGWRVVFFALLPVLALVAPLTLPAYRKIDRDSTGTSGEAKRRLALAVLLALTTGLFLVGLEISPAWLAVIVTGVGLARIVPTAMRLLPAGTFTARPMMPAAISTRAVAFSAFIVIETYMIFSLVEFGGVTATTAGLLLTAGSLTWTSGSILQSRWDRLTGSQGRPLRVMVGVTCMLLGLGFIFAQVFVFREIWLMGALGGWVLAGFGIGLSNPTSATIAFAGAPHGQEGMVSSSLLLADLFTTSIGVGFGGVALAFGQAQGWPVEASAALAMSVGMVLIVAAMAGSGRMLAQRNVFGTIA